jgi:hypothetical protein
VTAKLAASQHTEFTSAVLMKPLLIRNGCKLDGFYAADKDVAVAD